MKIGITFIFTMSMIMPELGAQVIYERTYDDAFPSIKNAIELTDSSTFSIGRDEKCNSLRIRVIDQFGNPMDEWLGEAFQYGFHWIGHDSILLWYEEGAYDVGPDSFKVELWTPQRRIVLVREEVEHQFVADRRYGAYLYQDSQIIYEKSDTILRKNLVTGENDHFSFFQGISDIFEFKNSFLVYFNAPFPKLLDADFNVIRNLHFPLPFDTATAVILDSFWIGKDFNNPQVINALNVYTEFNQPINLSSHLDSIEEIQVNLGSLFVKGIDGNLVVVVELTNTLELSHIHSLNLPGGNKPFAFQFSPSRAYAQSTDGMGKYKADYRICYPYLDPEPVKFIDIQLDTMWISSIVDHQYYSEIIISLQLTNLSSDTLHGFTLHYDNNEPYSTCFSGTNALHFKDLNIIQGSTEIINYHDYTTAFAHGGNFQRTYFIEHGNHHLDPDTTNNIFDLWHLISIVDDTEESINHIYPNPFSDFLIVDGDTQIIDLSLYDSSGMLIQSGHQGLYGMTEIPPGLYFLKVKSTNKVEVFSVFKGQ